ncbi:hypothetical protein EHQ52_03975 [Leptospira koniambonensis]|uniref:Uncharacterized protein n=1 Tax=Leptospira koniambonensis TaxID=2484950 RepID=A0A4R9JA66_9LEPT|nr:DUF5677 domain-containing protein [Leptospira koniambonensis]TGL35933.1 hypothetical protein EHQ52_03975 [Leptospira koniambonensis]
MNDKRNSSKLSEHRLHKKQGVIKTPFNDSLGNTITLTSWTDNRLPEYLWLGIILIHFDREIGLNKLLKIVSEIAKATKQLQLPKLSEILSLPTEEQKEIYKIIRLHVGPELLAPLTILLSREDYPIFNEYFYVTELTYEHRLQVILHAIEEFSPHQSNEATDLRFLTIMFLVSQNKINISYDSEILTKAILEYPLLSHEEEIMRSYRPAIRSLEGTTSMMASNNIFSEKFWRKIGMITRCNPMSLVHKFDTEDYESFINNAKKMIEYILHLNKESLLENTKFEIIMGSATYVLKILNEVASKSLGDCILGRQATRTILEIYIMLKYLSLKESVIPTIWTDYKLYGISKYKLILLKARETHPPESSHFLPPIAEALVNEIKWEEFIDIDLKYFDKLGIREKSIEVGEKYLYDLLYDYDSNFSHGLWGAIRESSMIICDNPAHRFHVIPDINFDQNLPDVKSDILLLTRKILLFIKGNFAVPENITKFLE